MSVDQAATRQASRSRRPEPLFQEQFTLPRGLLGSIIGWWMARENEQMNRVSVELLDVQSGDDVLEIGFGPGQAVELLTHRTPARYIAGIDPSEVMLAQAEGRNGEAIDAGRVELVQAAVERLPFADGRFSKAFAVSNFGIWESPRQGLREIKRVLRKGGLLLLCLRRTMRKPRLWTSPGVSAAQLENDRRLLVEQGFRDVHVVDRRRGRRIACLLATK